MRTKVKGRRSKHEGHRSKDEGRRTITKTKTKKNPSNPSNPLITPRTYRTHQTYRTYRTHQTHRNLLKEMFISVYRLEEDGGLLKEGAVWLTLGALRAQLL